VSPSECQHVHSPSISRAVKLRTVAFGNGVVQGREALVVGGVQGTPVLEEKKDYRDGADGGSAMDGVLASAVAHAG
jgi:hypothetical protein